VGRDAGERLVQPEPDLRVREPGEHPGLLVPEPRDLAVERDQVPLRSLGLRRELGELRPEPVDVRGERLPPLDEGERDRVVVPLDGEVELRAQAGEGRRLRFELPPELRPDVDDAGRRRAELLVLREAGLDRRLVDGARVAVLAAAQPLAERAAEQIPQSCEECHAEALLQCFSTSSTVSPSSRIFCWKFCRYMPTSSAALLMLPPFRRSAWSRKSRSNAATTRSFASRKDAPPAASAPGAGAPSARAGGRTPRSSAVISSPGASRSARSTAERSSRTLPFHSRVVHARSASAVSGFGARPKRAAASFRKWSMRSGTSSRRSASGGITSSTTRRR